MATDDEQELKSLLGVEEQPEESETRLSRALARARASVGQRDTMLFAFVRVWTTLAQLLAPVFAHLARLHVEASHGRKGAAPEPKKPTQ